MRSGARRKGMTVRTRSQVTNALSVKPSPHDGKVSHGLNGGPAKFNAEALIPRSSECFTILEPLKN